MARKHNGSKNVTWLERLKSDYEREFPDDPSDYYTLIDVFDDLDEAAKRALEVKNPGDEAGRFGVKALVISAITKIASGAVCAARMCESPIERAMFWSLCAANIASSLAFSFKYPKAQPSWPRNVAGDRESWDHLLIEPQAEIGDYRVDFLLTERVWLDESGVRTARMVIECDGHDYHERTKEQASADKERDRALQTRGYLVFRFTGSDLWRAPIKCANEALRALNDHVGKMPAERAPEVRLVP